MSFIDPKVVYGQLVQKIENIKCSNDEQVYAGKYEVKKSGALITVIDSQKKLQLLLNGNSHAVYLGSLEGNQFAISVADRNGNGTQEPGEQGNFQKLQEFLKSIHKIVIHHQPKCKQG